MNSKELRDFSDRYSPREPVREPGYHAPASVEELYFGPSRQMTHASYYQPIYEDQVPRYSTPVYAPLSGKFEFLLSINSHDKILDGSIYISTSLNHRALWKIQMIV